MLVIPATGFVSKDALEHIGLSEIIKPMKYRESRVIVYDMRTAGGTKIVVGSPLVLNTESTMPISVMRPHKGLERCGSQAKYPRIPHTFLKFVQYALEVRALLWDVL